MMGPICVLSPSWMPGTTALKVFDQGVFKLVGLVHVGFDASAEHYDSVEQLVLVHTPATDDLLPYPALSPNVPDMMGASPNGSITAEPIHDIIERDEFQALVNSTFVGTGVHSFVAGIDYFAGRPAQMAGLPPGREIRWAEKIALDYGGGVTLLAHVHAEKPAVSGSDRRFLVHQIQPFNLHWPQPESATCANDEPVTLGEVFTLARRETAAQRAALLYCRANVYDKGLVSDGQDWLPTAPGPRIRPVEEDEIDGIYPLLPLRG